MSDSRKERKAAIGLVEHTILTANRHPKKLKLGRKLAMALFCTECLGYETNPIHCTSIHCALYPRRKATRVARDDIQEGKNEFKEDIQD